MTPNHVFSCLFSLLYPAGLEIESLMVKASAEGARNRPVPNVSYIRQTEIYWGVGGGEIKLSSIVLSVQSLGLFCNICKTQKQIGQFLIDEITSNKNIIINKSNNHK